MSGHEIRKSRSVKAGPLLLIAVLLWLALSGLRPVAALAYSGGDGTSGNPYRISTVADLEQVRTDAANGTTTGKYYKLMNDLDLSGVANWEPIGASSGYPFKGNFDGDHHVIRNLTIDRANTDYVGLFGYIQTPATVKNLGLINVNVTGHDYVGGLVGNNDESTYTHDCYATGGVSGSGYAVGGLVGYNAVEDSAYVEACVWNVETTGQSSGGSGVYVGVQGKTTAEMKQKATFGGWNIDHSSDPPSGSLWVINEGKSYPYLRYVPPRPSVVSTDPADGAAGVSLDKTITVTYSENMQAGTEIGDITLKKDGVAAAFTYSKDNFAATAAGVNAGLVISLCLIALLIAMELAGAAAGENDGPAAGPPAGGLVILQRFKLKFSTLTWILFIIFIGIVYTKIVMILSLT